jgi:ComF family protein
MLLKIKKILLDCFLPINCFRCGKPHFYFCPNCASKLELYPNSFCIFCGRSSSGGKLCPDCQHKFFLKKVVTAFFYTNSAIKEAIHILKYQKAFLIARDLAQIIFYHPACQKILCSKSPVLLVPVPLTSKKEKQRGFNQSQKIAKNLSLKTKIPLASNLLLKTKETPPQAKTKNKKQRLKNLKDCFLVNQRFCNPHFFSQTIILIDDILTTGATLKACASVLFRAGFKNIEAITIARQTIRIKASN